MSEQQTPISDAGPAFPGTWGQFNEVGGQVVTEGGMSLRDYFAGQASDLVVHQLVNDYLTVLRTNEPDEWGDALRYTEWHCARLATVEARYRYAVADAMLAQREKQQ